MLHIGRTLYGAITPDHCSPGSNGNEGGFHIPKTLQEWSITIVLFSVIYRSLVVGGVLSIYSDTVDVYYILRRLGYIYKPKGMRHNITNKKKVNIFFCRLRVYLGVDMTCMRSITNGLFL